MKDFETFKFSDFNNYVVCKGAIVRTVKPTPDEDWKTALAHHIQPIPEGELLVVAGWLFNFYGRFIEISYNRNLYYVDPLNLEYIANSKEEAEKILNKRI